MPRDKSFAIRLSDEEYRELTAAARNAEIFYVSTYIREEALFAVRNGHLRLTASTRIELLKTSWEFSRLSALLSAMPQISHEQPVLQLEQQSHKFEAFLASLLKQTAGDQ